MSYWREREYTADQYAAALGQAEELADFLEIHALIHDHPVPLIWLTEHTHPPTELRIDKLRNTRRSAVQPCVLRAAAAGTITTRLAARMKDRSRTIVVGDVASHAPARGTMRSGVSGTPVRTCQGRPSGRLRRGLTARP